MKQYKITGMSCAACSTRVEKAVNGVMGSYRLQGNQSKSVNPENKEMKTVSKMRVFGGNETFISSYITIPDEMKSQAEQWAQEGK